ncbi:carbohydrate ABC transporter permease [Nonomuraea pusilla]|uniref:Carbohydrate ABC transporter membrane protein 2, CUT1 family (TC 3.A.1.1.-) n=1 Tax=Nonomuraea pusilla TaxID=46177 RepID=A0A1H8CA08_9ACTN|nr:carbohydrate ABC transporter permease [Nonomuraea pusilla]SEM91876.1 carbohydrate ABC transporter membrane protein 2, CUT1 family (TC 3.A.1.1.-) [Nonomuraea pusilla]
MTTSSHRPAWVEPPNPVVTTIKGVVIGLILLIMIYPLAYVILNSFASPNATTTAGLIPSEWSFSSYSAIFKGGIVQRSLIVSILITLVGTALSLAVTATLAYALTKTRQVPGVRPALYLVLLTMIFSAGIIPNYLVVKAFGLLDSYWSLIIPVLASAFNVVVMRNFFMQLPRELFEAARIDGAGELSIFIKIVLPLSKAVLAVIGLFYAVSYWNSFFNAMLYLNDSSKWPIQLVLNSYVLQGQSMSSMNNTEMYNLPSSQSVQMAVVVLATIPILVVYPFLQKYFTKGVLTGAIKG